MRVIIQRDLNNLRAGREMELPDGYANELIRRKVAILAPVVECMEIDHSNKQTAMLNRNPRKRG